MRIRESGMPDRRTWESFFDPDRILDAVGLASSARHVVEFGCGYGTFTIPVARRIAGNVHAVDIDSAAIAMAAERVTSCGLENVRFITRDFMDNGSGLPDASADYAMVFNILHCEDPVRLLQEVRRNLAPDGQAGIIHWTNDPETPRGPPLPMRPRPEQCREWALQAGFARCSDVIDLPPYHYGLVLRCQVPVER